MGFMNKILHPFGGKKGEDKIVVPKVVQTGKEVSVPLAQLLAIHQERDPRIEMIAEMLLKEKQVSIFREIHLLKQGIVSLEDERVLSFLDMLKLVYLNPSLQMSYAILSRPFILPTGEVVIGRACSLNQPEDILDVQVPGSRPKTRRITELWLCTVKKEWPDHYRVPFVAS